jgi:LPXTG-motif cell wall-anchored protein
LPSTLPQTGPEDWLKYLQVGLGVLGIGALLLLFL